MKKLLLLTGVLGLALSGFCQKGLSGITIEQNTHLPLGGTKDAIDQVSARSFSARYGFFLSDRFSLGLMVGYTDLYEKKERDTYKLGESDINAVKSNSLQVIPVLASGIYHSPRKENAVFQPYLGLNAGVGLVNYREYYGLLVDETNKTKLMIAPELGTRIYFGKTSTNGADVSLRYNYIPFKQNTLNNIQTISLNIGLSLFSFNEN